MAVPMIVISPLPLHHRIGRFEVRLTSTDSSLDLEVSHQSHVKWALSLTPTRPFVAMAAGPFAINESQGNFNITDYAQNKTTKQTIDRVDPLPGSLTICGSLGNNDTSALGRYNLTLRANSLTRRGLDFALTATSTHSTFNRLYLRWAAETSEQFYGMGEQYTIHGLRGRTVPIFASEQGVGRGAQPVSDYMNSVSTFHNGAGTWHTTYSAIGHYLTSELRSVALRGAGYTSLDFATADSGATTVAARVAAARKGAMVQGTKGIVGSFEGTILGGESPDEIVEGYTRIYGRMAPLPDWIGTGALVGFEGGTKAVRDVWARLKAAEVPLAGFWLQDWSGVRHDAFGTRLWWNWEVDPWWYPDWGALEVDLRAAGGRLTTYINPYLSNSIGTVKKNFTRNLWAEAADAGYLVRNASGKPYIQSSGSDGFTFSTIDLTNPGARTWTKRLIRCNLLGDQRGCDGNATASAPQSGYMSDFGEYIPFDSSFWSGEPAAVVHNKFPGLWSQVCREAQREAGRDGNVVFWSRSSSPSSPQWATAFWAGDQLTTWDSYDGLASALKGMLSGGLSGLSISHSDLGGYTMLVGYALRSKELLFRWMEMSVFSDAIFRSHPGNLPDLSAQVYSDNASLLFLSRTARMHAALWPYRKQLLQRTASHGSPPLRYMFYEYPSDPEAWTLSEQFMLGPELLVAPVLTPNATSVRLYLPRGRWLHAWTEDETTVGGGEGRGGDAGDGAGDGDNANVGDNANARHHGGKWIEVDAPLGQPAAFFRLPLTTVTARARSHLQRAVRFSPQGLAL